MAPGWWTPTKNHIHILLFKSDKQPYISTVQIRKVNDPLTISLVGEGGCLIPWPVLWPCHYTLTPACLQGHICEKALGSKNLISNIRGPSSPACLFWFFGLKEFAHGSQLVYLRTMYCLRYNRYDIYCQRNIDHIFFFTPQRWFWI